MIVQYQTSCLEMSFNQDSQLKVGLLDKPLAIDAVLRGRDIVNCNYRKGHFRPEKQPIGGPIEIASQRREVRDEKTCHS